MYQPQDFLYPDNFMTGFDGPRNMEYSLEQYYKGRQIGKDADCIHIAVNDVWGASMKDGSSVASYEKIGYHAATAFLLQGFLESGCKVLVHRSGDSGIETWELKDDEAVRIN